MMGPQDGVDHALRALQLLRQRRDDWRAIFAGDGDVVPSMEKLGRELGLDDLVEFTGIVDSDEVVAILASADVCLSPEPSNPLNDASTMMKVAEYLAMGRAVVAYDLPETRATAGDAARYCEPNNVEAFADAIAELLASPELRASLGRLGRRRAVDRLDWRNSARSLHAVYEGLLTAAGRTEPGADAAGRWAAA
jgi:glycosyltransferase involved in cell wall biosynthesis